MLVFHTLHDTGAPVVLKGRQSRKHEFDCRGKKTDLQDTFLLIANELIRAITVDHFDSSEKYVFNTQ